MCALKESYFVFPLYIEVYQIRDPIHIMSWNCVCLLAGVVHCIVFLSVSHIIRLTNLPYYGYD